jgi:hypothetical protein
MAVEMYLTNVIEGSGVVDASESAR